MTDVQLGALQSRVAALACLVGPPPATTGAGGVGGAGAASGADFASALDEALGGSQSAAGGSIAGSVAGTAARTGTAGQGLTVPSGVTGQDLVDAARAYLGTPYVWGGESLAEGGLDCSGLVLRSLADLGVSGVPRVARDQQTLGTPVASLAEAQPGDLVVFDGGKHIGIYAGEGKMIDAPRPGKTVQLRDVYETPTAIRRILPGAAGGSSAAGLGAGDEATPAAASAAGTSSTDLGALAVQRALLLALLTGAAA